jgi:drug/metabolite transporter (DMT)-like permease
LAERELGIGLALLSAFGWAVGSTLYKRLGDVSPYGLNLVGGVMSLGLLGILVAFAGGMSVANEALWLLAVSGVVGITLGDSFYFVALQDLGAHAVVVLSMLAPALTVVLAVLLLGETPSLQAFGGIALVIAGVSAVLWSRVSDAASGSSKRGVVFGLLAVLMMALGTVITKRGLDGVTATDATMVRAASGTLGLLVWGAVGGSLGEWTAKFRDAKTLGNVLLAVTVITFGGFWALHASLKHVDAAIAAVVSATEPLFVIPLAALVLGERIGAAAIVGTLVTAAGIALIYAG